MYIFAYAFLSLSSLLSSIGRIGSIIGSQVLKLDSDDKPWIRLEIFKTRHRSPKQEILFAKYP